jgi:DNA (cytosine-5)-methyltransferase 1
MNELALFAGAGGGILAGKLLGWRTVCAVEWEPYAACVLAARQNDGLLPPFPIWDDVQTFDGKPWRGIVDVVSGGFPCQDISVAGKGAGITGERSGMWRHMARIVGEVRPRYVFVENSPALITRGLGVVLGDLAALGYDCRWTVLGAADVGAPHQRDRFWLVAHANSLWELQPKGSISDQWRRAGDCGAEMADAMRDGRKTVYGRGVVYDENRHGASHETRRQEQQSRFSGDCAEMADADCALSQGGGEFHDTQGWKESFRHARLGGGVPDWYASEPDVGRVADGVAARVDRLKALGNGQVPLCAATAWRLLINASQSGQIF